METREIVLKDLGVFTLLDVDWNVFTLLDVGKETREIVCTYLILSWLFIQFGIYYIQYISGHHDYGRLMWVIMAINPL